MDDQYFLKEAIKIGNQKAAPYNFGAVIVKDGKLISAEHSSVQETSDPSRHAELCAIIAACKKLGSHHIDGAVLYTSHQPCVMCFSCAAWAHCSRVVYAVAAKDQGFPYEFKDIILEELAPRLTRPIQVNQITVEKE